MRSLPLTLAASVYDELGFFIGSDFLQFSAGWGEYKYYSYGMGETPQVKWYLVNLTIPLSTYAVVGEGTVFGNVYDLFVWAGGTAYAPEAHNTISFYIVS